MNQFAPISGKKLRDIPLEPFFQIPLYFLEAEDSIFKILYKNYALHTLENIESIFFYILINIKCSAYNRITKSKKNQPFIEEFSMDLLKWKMIFLLIDAQLNLT
jgi:hypothetical protein